MKQIFRCIYKSRIDVQYATTNPFEFPRNLRLM